MLILPSSRQAQREAARKAEVTEVLSKAVAAVIPGGTKSGKTIDLAKLAVQVAGAVPQNLAITPAEIQESLTEQGMDWSKPFAPGEPLKPYDGYGTEPRGWNYTSARNVASRPRVERLPFETLQTVIDGYDIAQICIQHILNDMCSMPIMFQPMEGEEGDVDDEIAAAKDFWRRPDGKRTFRRWLSMWMQDVLRYDAGALFRQKDLAGNLIRLKIIDGTTFLPLQDYYGERPDAPAPAFLQFIQGMPWDWLDETALIYEPFTPLRNSVYGLSPIESVLLNANTDVRFQMYFLQYFTSGTLPEGLMNAPEDLSSPDQIAELQETWDAIMMGDQEKLRQIRWVPAGAKFQELKGGTFQEAFPTYLLQRTVAGFSLTPSDLGFTEDVNRATSDTQMDTQFRISTQPRTGFVEDIMDAVTQEDLGLRVQVRFDTGREKEDRLMEAQAHQIWIQCGAESPDEPRRDVLGLPVNNEEMIPRSIMTERLGPIPLAYIVATSGEVDSMTGAPVPGSVTPTTFVVPGAMAPDPSAGPLVPVDDKGDPIRPGDTVPNKPKATAPPLPGDKEVVVPGDADDSDDDSLSKSTDLVAAGLCVRASDSGRVLLLQRSTSDPDDPAAGDWEFPGGCLEDGEAPYDAAVREWQEETGATLPDGSVVGNWTSPNGVYGGYIYEIPSESDLNINLDQNDRTVLNPDDPDCDDVEVVAWWEPCDLPGNPALRAEVQLTPWPLIMGDVLAKAAKVLRQWRANSRTRVKNGTTPKLFTDSVLPQNLAKSIWQDLQGVTTREEVDRAFAMLKGTDSPKAVARDRAVMTKPD